MRSKRGRGTTHWASPTTTRTLLLLVFGRSVQAQTTLGRWGQSSLLLSPSSNPYLIVTSGKTYVSGQTFLSTPSAAASSSFLSLDLSEPIQDLSNPPWKTIGDGGGQGAPIASYGNLVALNRSTGFWFGGDATGDPRVPIQTRPDSSYLVSLSPLSGSQSELEGSWEIPQSGGWVNQPERREMGFTNSATNGKITRSWIYGGVRSDGSGIGFNELWEMRMDLSDGSVDWAQLPASGMTGGPKGAIYDGSSVLVPSSQQGGDPTLYFLGGVDSSSNSLVSFDTIYSFTPSDTLASGTWSTMITNSTAIPSPRRGHSAIYLESESQIYISGGRDLTGTQVFTDNWILDLQAKSWKRVSDSSEASWGTSTVLLGETILMSFGYGLNSPASTSLRVYAYKNDTWLNSYYPSYQLATTVPTNPKASGSSSSTSSGTTSSSGGGNPSNPKNHQPASSSSSSIDPSSSSSNSDSSSPTNEGNSNGNTWTSPGQPNSPSNSDSTSDSSPKDRTDSGGGPPKSLVAGAVVGSLLGALVVAAVGVYGMKQRKRKRSFNGGDRYTAGAGSGFNRKFGYGGEDEEFVGMVEKENSRRRGEGSLTGLFALPTTRSTPRIGGGGGLAILGGGNKRRRFDILQDEEEEEAQTSQRGWTQFDDTDELNESSGRERVPSDMSDGSTRIGVGIWGGMGGGGGGLGRSESVKSGTSYLGTNLGGFLRSSDSSNSSHEYGGLAGVEPGGGVGDASLTPIAEWEEDVDDEDDEGGTLESGYAAGVGDYSSGGGGPRSSETHQTRSTFNHASSSFNSHEQHEEASIKTATRVIRPFSPSSSSSLYGSGFHTPIPFSSQPGGIARSTSTSSSLFLSPIRRDNSSSWWSRLKHQHQPSEIPTATALEAIRDPTPAPKNLEEQEQLTTFASDPFSDPTLPSSSSLERAGSLNEHGLMANRATRGIHDRSISSNVSEVTATSSILEERMRGMDVVQRIRTGEGSDGSASIGTNSNQNTPELSQDPFSDPSPPSAISQTPGSVIFAGSQAAFSPRRPESPAPSLPPFPLLPVVLPPTPTRSAQTPPQSPRKTRLIGPRPQPSQQLPTIARSGSVKDLVAEIERRNSLPSTPIGTPIPSPTKATRSRTTGHGGAGKTTKVEHGLVKKPKLYVANP